MGEAPQARADNRAYHAKMTTAQSPALIFSFAGCVK